jgi:two-component system, NarL family, nitrate/nitrite sensor histidine kinase NarX
MRKPWTLTAKLVVTGATFLTFALLSIGTTLWVSWHLEGGAAAVNEAGRLRMMTLRLAVAVEQPASAAELRRMAQDFEGSLALLRTGDPARPLFVPWSGASSERFEQVRSSWRMLRGRWVDTPAAARAPVLQDADAFVGEVDRFVAAIETELARWTALLHAVQLTLMALALFGAIALLYAGYLLVLNPVAQLARGVAALRAGDLSARVEVNRLDEFGELSAGFNEMAGHLQSLYGDLEKRVQEKTARLEVKRQRLADLYEVSSFTAGATHLDELAQGFAREVRRVAQADAVAVRWSDESNGRYVMLASENLPPDIAQSEGCLDAGTCHCGQSRETAATRVIPIVAATPSPLGHCGRRGFRTLVSVPVKMHERLLGEVDLFFRREVILSVEERGLLDMLASHLAGAMEGLRVAALEREQAVAQERGLLARELHDSIAQSLIFLKIQVQLLRDATARGDLAAARPIVDELDTGVRESYADVRELLLHFRTRTTEENIEPALQTTLSKFEHQTGLPTQLRIDARGLALAPDVQVQVLHIVQEALSNVRKHAAATRVWVDVSATPEHWNFEVRDDGSGFEAQYDLGEMHVGLRIMQERAARIGATVQVETAAGAGCTIRLRVPGGTGAAAANSALAREVA